MKPYEKPNNIFEDTFTLWRNPDDVTYKFKLQQDRMIGKKSSGTTFKEYTVAPGETVSISSEFDQAIRSVKNGVIMCGVCPRLEKVGEEVKPQMPDVLDWKKQQVEYDLKQLQDKLIKDNALKEAIAIYAKAKADEQVKVEAPKSVQDTAPAKPKRKSKATSTEVA